MKLYQHIQLTICRKLNLICSEKKINIEINNNSLLYENKYNRIFMEIKKIALKNSLQINTQTNVHN